ncbi:hypothetical protein QIS99_29710 [Streptomyces sp. B-S-A8]|uniref:Helix-turn-helix domain-containing protein n=1 Tax=Streptomyces solicavernae TaxID=3043614 RepID=A0ABT6S0Z7_9ACTN|nr:hypothetical protein [Streptomyces sp. B-S-A8]MDI3390337.1 hypothetical protein [Streptomyces sp. B-S-A8]
MHQKTIRTDMATALCTGVGCDRRAVDGRSRRLTVTGCRLCSSCRERLVLDLKRLPALYEECALYLDGAAAGGRPCDVKTSGGPLPGMPFNARAADVRSSILSVLSAWATLVLEERGLAGPRRAVGALTEFLARHGDWLAAHPAASEVSDEVARLVRSARNVIDPSTCRRIPVGCCVEPDCSGELTAVVRVQQPQLPSRISCTEDASHHWFGHEWLQLSRRIGAAAARGGDGRADGPAGAAAQDPGEEAPATVRWLTAADIARLWTIPPGSVYRHASTEKWRRRSRSGRTYYHGTDVHRTLHARRATAPAC